MANKDNHGSNELEMKSWLKKLKENQERKKEEKLRRYNDLVSKLIILLIAVCIVCVIAIAALLVQNENLKNDYSSLNASYNSLNQTSGERIKMLEAQNKKYQDFIFFNRTANVEHSVYIDPKYPRVSKIQFTNNMVKVEFVDGTTQERFFIDYNINI